MRLGPVFQKNPLAITKGFGRARVEGKISLLSTGLHHHEAPLDALVLSEGVKPRNILTKLKNHLISNIILRGMSNMEKIEKQLWKRFLRLILDLKLEYIYVSLGAQVKMMEIKHFNDGKIFNAHRPTVTCKISPTNNCPISLGKIILYLKGSKRQCLIHSK